MKQKIVREFNRDIKIGKIKMVRKNCLCGSTNFTKLFNYDRYCLWHPVVICKDCGLIMSNPQLTDEEYSKFYISDIYSEIYKGGVNFTEKIDWRYKDSNPIFQYLEPIMKNNNLKKIIEFGCGGGWNLIPFRNNGFDVIGYDYSPKLINHGKDNYNLNLKQGSFDDVENVGDFDLIILNHVIEHFTDMENSLEKLKKIIKPNGMIYVGLPNLELFARGQFQNAHTYYFTKKTFKHYMEKFGFEVIELGKYDTTDHMHGILKISEKNKEFLKINLKNEYKTQLKKIFFGVLKIRITGFLDSFNVLSFVKKILGK